MDSRAAIAELGLAMVARRCRESLSYFLRTFWGTIVTERPVWNWHIDALCNELQALAGPLAARAPKPYDLLINIPPGTTKSTIATIMFPAWLWTVDPTLRIITNSYSHDLSIEHAVKSRDVVTSARYRALFPGVVLRRDRAAKANYENTATGARYTTSTGGTVTGRHAHLIINDDPLNPAQAASEADRARAAAHVGTLASRKVDKAATPVVTIMQRLHEQDVTGHILARRAGPALRHICLPAELSDRVAPPEYRAMYTDGLLDPVRLPRAVLAEQLADLGARGYAGQYGQAPSADGGNIVKSDWFRYTGPGDMARLHGAGPTVFFIDTAYTEKEGNDPTGIIGARRHGNDMYITCAHKVRMGFPELVRWLPAYVRANGYARGSSLRVEPRANGISVIQQLRASTGLSVTATPPPRESKAARLHAASPLVECGRVVLVRGPWCGEFVEEVCGFPAKPHDEYPDLLCYACAHLLGGKGRGGTGLIEELY